MNFFCPFYYIHFHKINYIENIFLDWRNIKTRNSFTYFMFSNLLESGFNEVECFTILYIVMTRKMRLSCWKRVNACVNKSRYIWKWKDRKVSSVAFSGKEPEWNCWRQLLGDSILIRVWKMNQNPAHCKINTRTVKREVKTQNNSRH